MYCPRCGKQNPDAARVCSSCSSILPVSTEQAPIAGIKTSRLAIASLILAVLSPFTCFISAIPAIIIGIVALVKISQSAGRLKGTVLAIVAIVLPVVILPFFAFLMAILMPALGRTRQIAFRVACANNMKQIGFTIRIYSEEYDGKFPMPDKWCDLLIENAGASPPMFQCPAAHTPLGRSSFAMNKNVENFDMANAPFDMVLLFETKPGWNRAGGPELLTTENHQRDGCNVLYVDGHVKFVKTKDLNKLKW